MKRLMYLMVAMVVCGNVAARACNDQFPNKGSREAWERASKIYNDGLHLAKAQKADQAIAKFNEAIRIYPYDADMYANLGLVYENQKRDLQKAVSVLNTGIQQEPQCARIRITLAGLYFEQKNYTEARRAIATTKGLKLSDRDQREIKRATMLLNQQAK